MGNKVEIEYQGQGVIARYTCDDPVTDGKGLVAWLRELADNRPPIAAKPQQECVFLLESQRADDDQYWKPEGIFTTAQAAEDFITAAHDGKQWTPTTRNAIHVQVERLGFQGMYLHGKEVYILSRMPLQQPKKPEKQNYVVAVERYCEHDGEEVL